MATITTDTYLDGGTARTAGETWALNGGSLIVRTDSRWHANAPASMTGTLGNLTCSTNLGGGFVIDGTKVRWMGFNSGSGTVPAIGTSITQGGVSGYLLAVYADYTSAPTAVGASMPATGYIKFREVTGGAYSAGALTGISASAVSPDVVGWLEVVRDQGSTLTLSSLGAGINFQGDWFYLGTTTGSAGQLIQLPTNGGGSGTTVNGVQIETSPGSGIYEWYDAAATTGGFTTTALTTDIRAKAVQYISNGQIRIGSDGTSNIGYVPASGCKIRVPNLFLRMCTTAARASNAIGSALGNRCVISGPYGYEAYIDKVSQDWYFVFQFVSTLTATNSTFYESMQISSNQKPFSLSNILVSRSAAQSNPGLGLSLCLVGGTIASTKCVSHSTSYAPFSIDKSSYVTVTDMDCQLVSTDNNARQIFKVSNSDHITVSNTRMMGGQFQLVTLTDSSFTNTDFIDIARGNTALFGTYSSFALSFRCNNVVVDGVTFGLGGVLAETQPYNILFQTTNCSNITFKNAGTYSSPLSSGTSPSVYPNFVHSGYGDTNITVQRIYLTALRGGIQATAGQLSSGLKFEHIYGASSISNTIVAGQDSIFRGINYAGTTAGNNLMPGTQWMDSFSSTTAGLITFFGNRISAQNASLNTLSVASGLSGYTGSGLLSMKTSGDYLITEMPYFAKGITAFANSAPTITATGSYTYQYDLDKGSGFSGTWQTISGANLSAETGLNAATGVKMKMKITCTATATTNTVTLVKIPVVSTLAAQRDNLYPLLVNTLAFTGLVAGSEVRCYTGSNPATAVEIGGTESSGTTFSFTHSAGGSVGYIRVFALGYQPVNYDPYTFAAADTTILVQQTVDRNYVNPV